MSRISLFILFCLIAGRSSAQNLIPNSRFTQLNTCCEYKISCAPMGWWTSSTATFNFEELRYDKQRKPIPNPALVIMQGYEAENQRSYIQSPLLCPLDSGKIYRVSLKVKPRNYVFDSIGILVSDSFINIPTRQYLTVDSLTGMFRSFRMDSILEIAPTINLSPGKSGDLAEISFDYMAHGNEKFIVIGNFRSDRDVHKKRRLFHQKHKSLLFYEIRDVIFVAADGSKPSCPIDSSLAVLNLLNRRHSFYGRCSDSLPVDMNRLFTSQLEWQKVYFREDSKKTGSYLPFVPELGRGYRIENLEFEFDKAVIRPSSYPSLDSLVEILNMFPYLKVHIEGHTDSLGSGDYNRKLSLERAKAVSFYLIRAGLDPDRVTFEGQGSKKPVSTNDTEEGRQRNRRVEYYLTQQENP